MNRMIPAAVGLAVLFHGRLLADAYEDHEQFTRSVLSEMGELVTAFQSVKDRDTGRTAAARIEAVCDRIDNLTKGAEKLASITPADKKKLVDKYRPQLVGLAKQLQTAAFEAGVKAQGEDSFVRAVKRLQDVAKDLKKIEK